jgi:ubiquinone/menaquinone biosynthesis C-methylase UbiE
MQSNEERVKDYFEWTAKDFDSLYEENTRGKIFNRLFRRGLYDRISMALSEMRPLKGMSVLDVGSGSGRNSVLFAKAGASRVLGVDLAQNMVDLANEFSSENLLQGKCSFMKADFMAWHLAETFDYSVALGVFDYLESPISFLKKMKAQTRGRVIASFPGQSFVRAPLRKWRYSLRNCPLFFYTQSELEELFRSVGFSEVKIIPYASSGFLGVGVV